MFIKIDGSMQGLVIKFFLMEGECLFKQIKFIIFFLPFPKALVKFYYIVAFFGYSHDLKQKISNSLQQLAVLMSCHTHFHSSGA